MGVVPQFFDVTPGWQKRAVTLLLYQQPGTDMVAIARQVRQALAGFTPQTPPGVSLSKWYDQSTLVLAAAGSVRDAILIGIVLAAIVLMVFLRSWRITLLAMLIVPASLAAAVLVLSLLGMSFNIMTLGGLAASVGLVIDDVIVMIEHIARRSADHVDTPRSGQDHWVLSAGSEFLRPLTGSSAATLIVFAPLGFLTGVTGAFFKALSLTMASTLLASWLLTAFAVPLLAGWLIDFQKWNDPMAEKPGWLNRTHGHLLQRIFARPAILAVAVVVLLLAGWFSFGHVQTGFMPNLDEGGFVLDYQTAPGTSLTEAERELGEDRGRSCGADPAVASFSMRAGAGFGGDIAESNKGDFVIRLVPLAQRPSIDVVMGRISDAITAQVPGVTFDPHQLIGDEIGDLTGVPQPIEIKLAAADPTTLGPAALRVADAIGKIKGVDSVNNGIIPAGDAIDIRVDPARAAAAGAGPGDASRRACRPSWPATVATQVETARSNRSAYGWLNGVAIVAQRHRTRTPMSARPSRLRGHAADRNGRHRGHAIRDGAAAHRRARAVEWRCAT